MKASIRLSVMCSLLCTNLLTADLNPESYTDTYLYRSIYNEWKNSPTEICKMVANYAQPPVIKISLFRELNNFIIIENSEDFAKSLIELTGEKGTVATLQTDTTRLRKNSQADEIGEYTHTNNVSTLLASFLRRSKPEDKVQIKFTGKEKLKIVQEYYYDEDSDGEAIYTTELFSKRTKSKTIWKFKITKNGIIAGKLALTVTEFETGNPKFSFKFSRKSMRK
ncbi:hypothetical protein ACFLY6_01370 [Candidatus Dependentiae bacterium]